MTRAEAALRILEALTMAKSQVPTADETIDALAAAEALIYEPSVVDSDDETEGDDEPEGDDA